MKMIKVIKSNNTLTDEIKDVLNYILGKPCKGNYELYINNGVELEIINLDTNKKYIGDLDIDYNTYEEDEPAAYDWDPVKYSVVEVNNIYLDSISGQKVDIDLKGTEIYNIIVDEFQEHYESDNEPEYDSSSDF